MMMKKKLAALLLAAASAMVFTGCGSSDNQSKGGVDKKVQIEYWHVASESFGGTTVKELVADFNAKHPNIQVVEKYNPDMYKGLTQNLQAAIASGKNPDVVQMGWSYLNYAAENLKYTDLQPMIEKQAPEDKNFLKENYLPNVLALAQTDDGKQIGIPYSISVPVLLSAYSCIKKPILPVFSLICFAALTTSFHVLGGLLGSSPAAVKILGL